MSFIRGIKGVTFAKTVFNAEITSTSRPGIAASHCTINDYLRRFTCITWIKGDYDFHTTTSSLWFSLIFMTYTAEAKDT